MNHKMTESNPTMQLLKNNKLWILISLALLLIYTIARIIVPEYLDRSLNRTLQPAPYYASDKAKKLYDSLEFVSDLHSDVLLWDRDINQLHSYGHQDVPRMLKANIALQAFTIVNKVPRGLNFDKNSADSDQLTLTFILQGRPFKSWFNLTERVLAQTNSLATFAASSNGRLKVIKSQRDLRDYLILRKNDKNITAAFVGIEGAHALEGNLDNFESIYNAGVRMIGLTHFFDNQVGGSAHGLNKGGLTEFGQRLIHKMESKGVFVDLSHASPQLIDDTLAIASKPILVSHTGVKGTCDNDRNLSDQQIKMIAATEGLIGIAMFEKATCGQSVKAIAEAIFYTANLVGAKHVALGSDFDGAIATVFDVTGLVQIVDELLTLGMSEQDIKLVMGENVKRILLTYLPAK
jgi:membrane dipeptidase